VLSEKYDALGEISTGKDKGMGTRECKKIHSFVPIPVSHPANDSEDFGRYDWPRGNLNRSEKVLRFHGNEA
jgi:hypothetical protein